MIKEDYCSYVVSKLLEGKGFEGEIAAYVKEDNTKYDSTLSGFIQGDAIPCPTHQMAMKWLRKKGIFIEIGQSPLITKDTTTQEYHPVVINNNDYIMEEYLGYFIGYSNAVEAALKYCLTKLI